MAKSRLRRRNCFCVSSKSTSVLQINPMTWDIQSVTSIPIFPSKSLNIFWSWMMWWSSAYIYHRYAAQPGLKPPAVQPNDVHPPGPSGRSSLDEYKAFNKHVEAKMNLKGLLNTHLWSNLYTYILYIFLYVYQYTCTLCLQHQLEFQPWPVPWICAWWICNATADPEADRGTCRSWKLVTQAFLSMAKIGRWPKSFCYYPIQ